MTSTSVVLQRGSPGRAPHISTRISGTQLLVLPQPHNTTEYYSCTGPMLNTAGRTRHSIRRPSHRDVCILPRFLPASSRTAQRLTALHARSQHIGTIYAGVWGTLAQMTRQLRICGTRECVNNRICTGKARSRNRRHRSDRLCSINNYNTTMRIVTIVQTSKQVDQWVLRRRARQ